MRLATFQGEDLVEDGFWHIECWVQWFNEKVAERFESIGEQASQMLGMSLNQMKGLYEASMKQVGIRGNEDGI